MKIALIADIHGNLPALNVVLEDIRKHSYDEIICLGDFINPLRESLESWDVLNSLKIPILRGNHEDYIINYHEGNLELSNHQQKPIKLVAEHLGSRVIEQISKLPISLVHPGPSNNNLFVCHASAFSNANSYYDGITIAHEEELQNISEKIIITAHKHLQWHYQWKEKHIVSLGSVGMSLTGKPLAQYLVLEYKNDQWNCSHKNISYDNYYAVEMYRDSGWLHEGGVIAWLYADQILTGKNRLTPFFLYLNKKLGRLPFTDIEWINEARSHLIEIDRWETIKLFV